MPLKFTGRVLNLIAEYEEEEQSSILNDIPTCDEIDAMTMSELQEVADLLNFRTTLSKSPPMAKSALANYIYEYTDEGEPNADTDDDDDEEIDAEELLFTDHPLVGSDPPDNEDDGDPDEETDDDDINAILGDLSEVGKLIKTNPKQGKKRAIRLASDDLNDGEYYAKPLAKAKADLAKADTALRDERALSKGLSFSLTEVLDCFDEEFILERFSPEIVKFYKEIYPILIVAVHKNVTKRRNAKIKEHNERVARYNELAAELGQKQLPLIKK